MYYYFNFSEDLSQIKYDVSLMEVWCLSQKHGGCSVLSPTTKAARVVDKGRPKASAWLRRLLMTAIVSYVHCLPHHAACARIIRQPTLSFWVIVRCDLCRVCHTSADCHLWAASVRHTNASRRECGVTSAGFLPHLEVPAVQVICRCCFCSPDLLQSVKNWCQHLSKGKCLFYTECQSSHNLLINQAATKQILCVCVCARLGLFANLCVCVCVGGGLCVSACTFASTHAPVWRIQQRIIQVYYSAISEKVLK